MTTEPTNSLPSELIPRTATVDEIAAICVSGQLDGLIGIFESRQVEFKQQMDLSLKSEKQKLAKAVASFANASGGILLVGVVTERSVRTRRDYSGTLKYIEGAVDLGQYYRVINDFLYPAVAAVVAFHPYLRTPDQGVISVRVEPGGAGKPILVTETIQENLNGGTIFGYYRRDEESSNNVRHAEVHALLQAGERLKEVGDLNDLILSLQSSLKRIEDKLGIRSPEEGPQYGISGKS